MPKKPTKWGMKVFVLADVHSGYMYNWYLYTGNACYNKIHVCVHTHKAVRMPLAGNACYNEIHVCVHTHKAVCHWHLHIMLYVLGLHIILSLCKHCKDMNAYNFLSLLHVQYICGEYAM